MEKYKNDFIEFALANNVLCMGEYVLKSGRKSPYFFNSGFFNNGKSLMQLGHYYAQAIQASGIKFDMLYGPAYKGIPLASAVAIAFATHYDQSYPFSFNRKEIKDHGEGGNIFGARLSGRVLIIDDVISAGTSINNALSIINQAGATAAGAAVAMDRQERGEGRLSAVQVVERQYGISVISVITLNDLLDYLDSIPDMGVHLSSIRHYRDQYGI